MASCRQRRAEADPVDATCCAVYAGSSSSPCAVYALSAMICQIQDLDEEDAGATSTSERLAVAAAAAARSATTSTRVAAGEVAAPEGHLVSLIKVGQARGRKQLPVGWCSEQARCIEDTHKLSLCWHRKCCWMRAPKDWRCLL